MLNGLTTYIPQITLYDNLEFLIRIVLAGLLGMIIGLERAKRQKEAGTRTHCIIACTAAAMMILSKYAFGDVGSGDGARIAAQVVSGISFLGAGVIFRSGRFSIQGLTTAAGIWGTAGVGMAVGAGLYWVGLILAAALVVTQVVLHRITIGADAQLIQEVTVRFRDEARNRQAFEDLIHRHQGQIIESSLTREGEHIRMALVIRLSEPVTHEEALELLTENPGIIQVNV